MGLFDKPKPPDPMQTAQTQQGFNIGTGVAQQNLNMVGQKTPFGTLDYHQVGTNPDGTPRFEATTTLSPQMQGLFNTQIANQQDIASKLPGLFADLSKISGTAGTTAGALGSAAGAAPGVGA